MWFVYALVDPRDDGVRYVGVTTRDLVVRLAGHLHDPTNRAMYDWLADVKAAGVVPAVRLLIATVVDWQGAERGWIAWFRERGDLLNVEPGGICRDKRGKRIPSRMKPPAPYDAPAPESRRKRRRRIRRSLGQEHSAKLAKSKQAQSVTARAAEISKRQMARLRRAPAA